MVSTGEGEDVSAMVPPKKRGAAAAAGGEADPKRAKGASGRAARAANRAHEDEHAESDAAQHAIVAAAEQEGGKGKRARKPTAKQAAAAREALEKAAGQDSSVSAAAAAEQHQEQTQQQAAAIEHPSLTADATVEQPQQEPQPTLAPPADEQQQQDLQLQQQQQQQEAAADAAAAVPAPFPADTLQQPQQADEATADPTAAAAAVAASMQLQAADAEQLQQQQLAVQQAAAQQPQYDPAQQQQQQIDPAHLQQLYAQHHMDPHAQGPMQPEAAGAGDLQALFDTSSLVLGVALVVPDPQGSNAEQHWEPVSVPVNPHSTVSELKQRISQTIIHGQTFQPEQQGLSLITTAMEHIVMHEYHANGQPITLEQYQFIPGGAQRHTVYLRIQGGHDMMAGQGDPGQQGALPEQPELNPDGSEKKKRRQHTRWKEEEVMRLLEGVESLGVGHWRQMQRDFQLEHRTDVDLKDKWRNITKAIGQNKKMRGFNMAADLVLRVQNCMRLAAEKKLAKQANEGGHAPGMEHAPLEQHQGVMPPDAEAAAQAAVEGAAVQGVLDGALPQVPQAEGDVHVDIMDPTAGQYQQQLQGIEPQEQQQQQHQQHHDPAVALPTQHDPNTQQDPHVQQVPNAQQDPGALAAAQQHEEQQQEQQQQQQQQRYHDGIHEHDPGAVVLPVPQFDHMGHSPPVGEATQVASPPASGALPSAPPLEPE